MSNEDVTAKECSLFSTALEPKFALKPSVSLGKLEASSAREGSMQPRLGSVLWAFPLTKFFVSDPGLGPG